MELGSITASPVTLRESEDSRSDHVLENMERQSIAASCPPDILYQIFLASWTIPARVDLRTPDARHALFPWLLTHVCRQWRYAALAFPKFWSFIDLVQTPGNAQTDSPVHHLLETFLRRSGDHPLKFCLRFSQWEGERNHRNEPRPSPLMDALLEHSVRWEEVYLHRPWEAAVGSLSQQQGTFQFPILRRFTCKSFDLYSIYPWGGIFDSIPWNQFERYDDHAHAWYLDDGWQWTILAQLTRVVALRTCFNNLPSQAYHDDDTADPDDEFEPSVVTLPHLRFAFLGIHQHGEHVAIGYKTIRSVLELLDLPNLEGLSLRLPKEHCPDILYPVPHQLRTLKILRLCGSVQIPDTALTRILTDIPTLTDFGIELYDSEIDAQHLFTLLRPSSDRVLVPSLQTLRITAPSSSSDGLVELFFAMLRERFGGVAGVEFSALRVFILYHSLWRPALAIMPELEEMKLQEGWDIRVDQSWPEWWRHGDCHMWEEEMHEDFL